MDINDLQNVGLMPLQGDTIAAFARLPTFENPAVRPAHLAHVVPSTNNVDRISSWYSKVLGAESTRQESQRRSVSPEIQQ